MSSLSIMRCGNTKYGFIWSVLEKSSDLEVGTYCKEDIFLQTGWNSSKFEFWCTWHQIGQFVSMLEIFARLSTNFFSNYVKFPKIGCSKKRY